MKQTREQGQSINEPTAGNGSNTRGVWRAGLLTTTILQAVFLVWLFAHGRDAVCRRICLPDTQGYVLPAESVLQGHRLPPDMTRTIGYPLFLVVPFWLGGETYGYHLAIVIQSILNLLATMLFQKLLIVMMPQIRRVVLLTAVGIFWCAAFGLALYVLSDFLFGFLLLVFLYGFWVTRGPVWLAVSAGAILAAGLTRPSLGPFLFLLPLLKILVQRWGHYVPTISLFVYATAIVISSAVNFTFEHSRAHRHSDGFMVRAVQVALEDTGLAANKSEVTRRIAVLAGQPYDQLTRHERNTLSRHVFIEYVSGRPLRFLRGLAVNALKYMVAPVEGVVRKVAVPDEQHNEAFDRSPTRKIVLLLGLPVWALALWPGMARRLDSRNLYLFSLVLTLYFIGLGSAFGRAGERFRFPALPMLLVCFACNLDRLVGWTVSRLSHKSVF